MKKINVLTLLSLSFMLFLFTSCKEEAKGVQEEVKIESEEFAGEAFGEGITSSEYMDFEEIVDKLKNTEEVTTVLKAKVQDVCQAKGCWMNLVDDKGGDQPFFVKFHDYGFFVPKDIGGREVLVEGKAYKEMTTVDELRHYAEDAGKSKEEIEAITEPVEELKFMATGVLVLEGS